VGILVYLADVGGDIVFTGIIILQRMALPGGLCSFSTINR
jgi:hypothetical protein